MPGGEHGASGTLHQAHGTVGFCVLGSAVRGGPPIIHRRVDQTTVISPRYAKRTLLRGAARGGARIIANSARLLGACTSQRKWLALSFGLRSRRNGSIYRLLQYACIPHRNAWRKWGGVALSKVRFSTESPST
jgi:hypothetical protein